MHIKASRRDRNDQEKSSPVPTTAPWVVLSALVLLPFPAREEAGRAGSRAEQSGNRVVSLPGHSSRLGVVLAKTVIVERHNLRGPKLFTTAAIAVRRSVT